MILLFCFRPTGWPKYGNWGVNWPTDGIQNMPVATDFIAFFNELALQVMLLLMSCY
jgi:hypothetical protein